MANESWIKRGTLAWLLVAQGVTILPLFIYLPFWTPLVWLIALLWRVQIFRGAWPFPSNKSKFLLGAVCIAAIVASYGGTLGVEPLVAFLVVSFVLKLVEVRSRKDALLLIYVGFIAVAAQFLFFQTIFIAFYGLLSTVIFLCAWNCIYRTQITSTGRQIWSSTSLVLQSFPLMVLLFLVLPRVGTLWQVPIPQKTGVTGFSDSMSPGDFASLSQSREVAFRVTFEERQPARNNWYWRGLVLDDFDGRRWQYEKDRDYYRTPSGSAYPSYWNLVVAPDAEFFRYRILMEPHQQQWLFTMMAPVSVSDAARPIFYAPGYLTRSAAPVASRTQYSVVSTQDYVAHGKPLGQRSLQRNLLLPQNANPRTQKMAREWRAEGLDTQALVDRALARYQSSFTYTLRPPPLGTHSVDEFLFFTQRGFCEHFSSSFVVLMRAAGVPARVVVGYQGGEFNPAENYIIVRQADAHAWAEVWFENRGWVRIDPTAAVAPSRIERGLQDSLQAEEQSLVGPIGGSLMGNLQLRLDAMSYSWHQWVLGYDSRTQSGIFNRIFGDARPWKIALAFAAVASAILGLYFLWMTWRARKKYDYPEQDLYAILLKRLARKGYDPDCQESPHAFLQRVGREQQTWRAELLIIAKLYNTVAYRGDDGSIDELDRRIRGFRPR